MCSRWLCVCVCGTVFVSECAAGGFVFVCVGQLGSECAADGFLFVCVWDSCVSECAACGFVLCVCVGQLGE